MWTFPTPQAKELGPLRSQPGRDDACGSRCHPYALRRALLRSSTREPCPSDARPCRPCSQSLAVSPDPSTQIRDLPLPHFPPACEGSFGLFPGVRCRTPVEPFCATAVPRWGAFPAANVLSRLQIASCRTAERHYRWAVVSAPLPPRMGRQTQQQTAEMPLLGKGVLTGRADDGVEKGDQGGRSSIAARSRADVRSRPSSSSTSKRLGLTARPVTATRVACMRAAAFELRSSAMPRSTDSR
jgi:hypothetical protein